MVFTYMPKIVKIEKVWNETDDTKTLRLNYPIKHEPGQFVELSVVGVGEAPFGICSYSDKYIDVLVREVGNVTHAVHNLKQGDKVGIRGPYGTGYPMHHMENDSLLIVGGGTGVAPLRSVVEYVRHNREKYKDIHLFLGFRDPKEILFKRDIKNWEKEFNLHLTVDKADKKWKGNVGLVTALLEKSGLNNHNKIAATCGPPIMIKFVIKTLKKMGFNDDQIYVSMERLMQCGMGKCGHCIVGGKYVCEHGPVFNYNDAKWLED
ncbi:FAD/NAD(P)-binding protein [Candidatus Woesearchaeota archaeon]|nr:FAD/NAD(P)-binding protein [Candidatus Woesearchaeota archaeon]